MHPRDVVLIVETVRTQLAHNALFESLVRAHNANASMNGAVEIRLTSASIYSYDLVFTFRRTAFIGKCCIVEFLGSAILNFINKQGF